ncbi:hypothetical protein F4780DRAFT_779893 [Xylariomycetidae sp. FL0641]|nr:hypothetical protein F4780DRAFT_779893 [Xylariomycetidae sp. FL0641]
MSYVEGPTEPPLLPHTIPEHFAEIVAEHGDRPAVIARAPTTSTTERPRTTTLTYADLDALSNRLARALRGRLDVRPGDRVAVSLGSTAEHVALSYAVFKLGAVLVPLNPGFTAPQVAAALTHLDARVLVLPAVTDLPYKPGRGRSNAALLAALVGDGDGEGEGTAPPPTPLRHVVLLDNTRDHPGAAAGIAAPPAAAAYPGLVVGYEALLASAPSAAAVAPARPLRRHDTANIQFTSGTTSAPKAARLSHANILNNGRLVAARMGLAPADRVVVPPPLFHCFGAVLGLQATATTGAALLLPSPAFDPAASLRLAADAAATGLYGVATMFVAELRLLGDPGFRAGLPPGGLGRLRKGIAAGSPVPPALMRRLVAELGLADLVICYGMTETSPVTAMTAPGDGFAKRTTTVGRAMPHTALKVVAPGDRARILPRGARGELAAAGYAVMAGYYGEAAAGGDRVADAEGRVWMYTGDEAVMDAEGYVAITGRIKDLIIRGGENIHPLEVEDALFRHPGVREASVVGVPDARLGEAVAAFVVRADPALRADDVRAWVRRELAAHLVPQHVFWLDEYPKTASGKIMKYKLRDMARELVAAGEEGDT